MPPKKKKTVKNKKQYSQKQCTYLVEGLVNKTARTNYAIQIKTAKVLLDMYSFEFWRFFVANYSGKKKTSLIGYITPQMKEVLKNYKRLFDNEEELKKESEEKPKKELTLSDDPLYLVSKEDFKPTRFLDFIKKYEKE